MRSVPEPLAVSDRQHDETADVALPMDMAAARDASADVGAAERAAEVCAERGGEGGGGGRPGAV